MERVLCKASRTTSGSDSYFTVEQLFTNSDYLLKRRAELLPPINVEVKVAEATQARRNPVSVDHIMDVEARPWSLFSGKSQVDPFRFALVVHRRNARM